MRITFERTDQTDRLKPEHKIKIGRTPLELKWLYDDRPIHPPEKFPGLAPDHLSSQNIHNALNDDCLREIFLHLNMTDQSTVSQVCQRFQDVVMRISYKHVKITDDNCNPLWKLEEFFRIFGASIQTVNITTKQCADIVMIFVSKFCANLKKLSGKTHFLNTINQMVALYPRLHQLELHQLGNANVVFQPNAQIESIIVRFVRRFPPIHLPKLRVLQANIGGSRLDTSIKSFFALNRQIQKLVIEMVAPFPISNVVSNLLNLQEFHASFLDFDVDNAEAIGQLKRLHTLRLDRCIGNIVPTWRAFIENGVQLKHLVSKNWRTRTDNGINYIIHMSCLESLELDCLNDDELARILNKCTNLREIVINSRHITPRGIRCASMYAAHLQTATFRIDLNRETSDLITDQIVQIDAIAEMRTSRMINIQVVFNRGDVTCSNIQVSFYLTHVSSIVGCSIVTCFSLLLLSLFYTEYEKNLGSSQRLDNHSNVSYE